MLMNTIRKSDEPKVSGSFDFLPADIAKAFTDQSDPDEILYYQLFSSEFEELPISQRFLLLARVAALVEGLPASALNETINLEPKGTPA